MKRRILYSVILLAVAVAAVEAMKYGHDAAAPAAKPVITAPETTVICAAGVIEPAAKAIKLRRRSPEFCGTFRLKRDRSCAEAR